MTATHPLHPAPTGPAVPAGEPPATLPKPRPARSRRGGNRSRFGAVRQLPSGRWQARYTDTAGVRRTAPRTFATKRDADDWLATSRADQVRGDWQAPDLGRVALSTYAADYLTARVDLSPTTLGNYRQLVRGWLSTDLRHPTGRTVNLGRVHLCDLSPALVRDWRAAALSTAHARARERAARSDARRRSRALHAARVWAAENGLHVAPTGRLPREVVDAWRASGAPAAATLDLPPTEPAADAGRSQVSHAYALLRSILNAAVEDGLIRANPCTVKGAGQVSARERVPATPAEVAALAALVPAHLSAAVHVAAWSGLRAGELFGLTRAHVNLTAGTVRVERALKNIPGEGLRFGPPKTPASLRTVHLPPPVVTILAEHMAAHTAPGADALVFARPDGRPVDSRHRTAAFRVACAHIGRHDLRWHDLRHTGATMAAQAGASLRELQARLGHSTAAAAMTYQHATAERDRALAERMAALVAPALPVAPEGIAPDAAAAAAGNARHLRAVPAG